MTLRGTIHAGLSSTEGVGVMATRLAIITAVRVNSATVSANSDFVQESGVNMVKLPSLDEFGFFTATEKNESPQWDIHTYRKEPNAIRLTSCSVKSDSELPLFLKTRVPNCVLLIALKHFEVLKAAGESADITILVHHYRGTLHHGKKFS